MTKQHFEVLDTLIYEASKGSKFLTLETIADRVRDVSESYERVVIKDRVVTLTLCNKFTRQGRGGNTRYRQTRDVALALARISIAKSAPADAKEGISMSAKETPLALKTPTFKMELDAKDGLDICIWKVMADGEFYTASDVALLLVDLGFKPATVSRTVSLLHANKGWFERKKQTAQNRQIWAYKLRDDIQMPIKAAPTVQQVTTLPPDGIVARIDPSDAARNLNDAAISQLQEEAEALLEQEETTAAVVEVTPQAEYKNAEVAVDGNINDLLYNPDITSLDDAVAHVKAIVAFKRAAEEPIFAQGSLDRLAHGEETVVVPPKRDELRMFVKLSGMDLSMSELLQLHADLKLMGYGDKKPDSLIKRRSEIKGVMFDDEQLYEMLDTITTELRALAAAIKL